jgi:hypothetical protein
MLLQFKLGRYSMPSCILTCLHLCYYYLFFSVPTIFNLFTNKESHFPLSSLSWFSKLLVQTYNLTHQLFPFLHWGITWHFDTFFVPYVTEHLSTILNAKIISVIASLCTVVNCVLISFVVFLIPCSILAIMARANEWLCYGITLLSFNHHVWYLFFRGIAVHPTALHNSCTTEC